MGSSRNIMLLLLVASAAFVSLADAKTVFRRTDKISENFKQLDLPPEEIDPNVAPPESDPPKVDDVDDIADEVASASTSLIDESANEISSGDVEALPAEAANAVADAVPAAAAAADAAPAPAPAAAAAAAAVPAAVPAALTTVAPKVTTVKPATEDKNPINRYCKCTETHCDCCRKIGLPLLPSGQGCAKIAYLGNDEMSVSLKYGDITLASRRISSKKARPICVGLPGGYNQFCGRVYGLGRAKDNFKACLAFELRADDEVEAQLRVSCFKFGKDGLRVAEAEPLPAKPSGDDDDDDDDDIFGFAAGGDDDEDEEDDYDADADTDTETDTDDDDDTDDYTEDDDAEAPEEADYGGFSLAGLLDELDDDDDEKPVKKPAAAAAAITPAVDQTREEAQTTTDLVQSKDDAGATAAAPSPAAVAEDAVEEAVGAVTPAPAETSSDSTTPKAKKSKKAKKNKKKKAVSAGAGEESGFAYELLNGILDFFN
ncbi:uncharacterized protein [Drosophila pseudoobscura]|uniref:DUF4773 domain-containing protein n=1 Tax=Drosophila pseudoobscura pseudoobscura TaxID=46245 RepID=A0A6I8UGT6_DROPS|nr:uncharacterized protein LOC4815227 [Drosophila pseudoobscura]XP_015042129.2 uncharacterized protein LOC4815227 [Drosophila pseudoobscura]